MTHSDLTPLWKLASAQVDQDIARKRRRVRADAISESSGEDTGFCDVPDGRQDQDQGRVPMKVHDGTPPWRKALDALIELGEEVHGAGAILAKLRDVSDGYSPSILVANAGMLKAGKSSLLNALVGEDERFATGDARKTVANQEFTWGNYTLVDTPGIDAKETDTVEAEKTFCRADLLLVVHSVTNGEYDRMEIDFLQQLVSWLPDRDHRSRVPLPVLTKIDMVGSDLAGIREACSRQWKEVVGVAPPFFAEVSNSRCIKGLKEDRPRLIELSGIPELRRAIRQRGPAMEAAKRRLFRDRLNEQARALSEWLTREIEESRSKKTDLEKSRVKQQQDFERDAKEVFAAIDDRYRQYRMKYGMT